MPTYGYRCQSCDKEFDVWQRMTDEAVASCPSCGGNGKRQFFPAGLVFKGSGFYVTDNRGSAPSSSSNGSADKGKGDTAKTSKPDSGSSSSGSKTGGSKTGTSSGAASGSSTE